MATITAKMVSELREKTGAGMMECKKALVEADGNSELALDVLRKAGIAKAEKKASRAVKDGLVLALVDGNVAAQVEVLCETDFVAKTDKFRDFVKSVAEKALTVDAEGDVTVAVQEALKDVMTDMIAKIGENMQVRRAVRWVSANGTFGVYSHANGKIGVLVDAEGETSAELLSDICMHITAFNPSYIDSSEIPEEAIAHEKEIAAGQVAGKPANIIEGIVNGKIKKWFGEVCLMNQPWLRDDKSTLAKVAPNLKVNRFARWELGA